MLQRTVEALMHAFCGRGKQYLGDTLCFQLACLPLCLLYRNGKVLNTFLRMSVVWRARKTAQSFVSLQNQLSRCFWFLCVTLEDFSGQHDPRDTKLTDDVALSLAQQRWMWSCRQEFPFLVLFSVLFGGGYFHSALTHLWGHIMSGLCNQWSLWSQDCCMLSVCAGLLSSSCWGLTMCCDLDDMTDKQLSTVCLCNPCTCWENSLPISLRAERFW